MGRYDSCRTRVAPTFNWLQCWDPTGEAWVLPLLSLARRSERVSLPSKLSPLRKASWWPREAKLPAPVDLLRWLVQNCAEPESPAAWGSSKGTQEYRNALVRRDPAKVADALSKLGRGLVGRAAHVLEGPSQPDAFLATEELIVVVEGKRTEPAPTTSTWWMRTRHQMLRHLDAAWVQRGERQVVGLMIIEEDQAQEAAWKGYAEQMAEEAVLQGSLPHRSSEDRRELAASFLGITTWQRVCGAFNIPLSALPNQVLDTGV